ncbi:PTS sugar transporter subunit IIA [Lentilactobacillus kisonensis]|nr:PTS sugar transporter subunit IIA [Lentilactobacillus kisonensis]
MGLGNGIMLAHASPNDGVTQLGMSITVFKKPFALTESTKKIKLVIGLAPIDEQQHLSYLGLLMRRLQDKDWLNNLYSIDDKDKLVELLQHSHLLEQIS